MSRSPLPLVIEDVSDFAQALRKNLSDTNLSQSQALQLIARAAGYRNHQEFKAKTVEANALDDLATKRVKDALRVFDDAGVMIRWPQKTSVQRLCLAWFWSRLPARRDLTEKEVNEVLKAGEQFGDHVLLRRSLIDHKLVTRTIDGRSYRRIERQPDNEERAVIRVLSERLILSA